MKRLLTILISILLFVSLFSFVGCKENKETNNGTVSLTYYASASDMLPLLKQGKLEMGVLPEPAATQLTKIASDKTWYRTDLQALYDNQTKAYPQAVIMVKQSFLNTYPVAVTEITNAFGDNVSWVKENVESAVNALNSALVSG